MYTSDADSNLFKEYTFKPKTETVLDSSLRLDIHEGLDGVYQIAINGLNF